MSIDKNFQFTKKSVDGRMRAPKIVKAQKTYENNGACEACGAVITKGSYVLTVNEVSGSKWSHDMRTVKTHRLCASCTAEYIASTSTPLVDNTKGESMEFDKSKILTVVTADQAKVGQKGWFGVLPKYIQEKINTSEEPSVLYCIDLDSPSPFTREGGYAWPLFYPVLEPTYAERQAEWIKENNIKVGTKVRFTKGFDENADGSGCCEHRDAKGKEGFVSDIEDEYLFVRIPSDGWAVPFTALEVIKEPTYRQYNNDELNHIVGKLLIRKGCEYPCLVTSRYSMTQVSVEGHLYNAEQLLELFTLNGDPCGVKEER